MLSTFVTDTRYFDLSLVFFRGQSRFEENPRTFEPSAGPALVWQGSFFRNDRRSPRKTDGSRLPNLLL
jgi:hypothetical protein